MEKSQAQWITCPKEIQSPIVFKTFTIDDFQHVEIDISGLGFYMLYINGKLVDNGFFRPRASNYCSRDLTKNVNAIFHELKSLVYVDRYDITEFCRSGENTIAVMLGNGYFRNEGRPCEGDYIYGESLRLFFDLKITSAEQEKHVVSDGNTHFVSGYILENQLHTGEVHDLSLYDTGVFVGKPTKQAIQFAQVLDFTPQTKISDCPPDRVIEKIKPQLMAVCGKKHLYNVGENITGWVRVCAKACDKIQINYAEDLNENGGLEDTLNLGNAAALYSCTFLNTKGGEELIPFFSWAGFQYFEIEGEYESLEVEFVSQLTEDLTTFSCDNNVLNWFYDAYKRGQKGNVHVGIPSDCPHRERYGYTADGQLIIDSALLYFSCEKIMAGWCREIANTQDPNTGLIYNTAPCMGGGGGPGGWGIAIILVPYALYQSSGKIEYLKEYFNNMQAYLGFMKSLACDGIIKPFCANPWLFLGDWSLPGKIEIMPEFVNTYFYILAMQTFETICEILNRTEEISVWKAEREVVTKAFVDAYYDENTGSFLNGVQGADAFALRLGLGTEQTKKNLVEKYEKLGQFDTGCFGTEILIGTLFKEGYAPLAYRLLTSEKEVSFGGWMKKGATTLWETWNVRAGGDVIASQNHPFFGAVAKYIFTEILGIHRLSAGGKEFLISPRVVGENGIRRGTLTIPNYGKISVEVIEANGELTVKASSDGDICLMMNEAC